MRKINKKMYLARTTTGHHYILSDKELGISNSPYYGEQLTYKNPEDLVDDKQIWFEMCRDESEIFGFNLKNGEVIQVQITVQEIKNNGKGRGRSGQGRKTIKRSR